MAPGCRRLGTEDYGRSSETATASGTVTPSLERRAAPALRPPRLPGLPFHAPRSARPRRIEFPAGSGDTADYWPDELAIMGALSQRSRAYREAGDPEEAAAVRGEAALIHALKVAFPGSVLRGPEGD